NSHQLEPTAMTSFGSQSDTLPIRAAILKRPQEAFIDAAHIAEQWQSLHYLGEPDLSAAVSQHAAFTGLLSQPRVELRYLAPGAQPPLAPGSGGGPLVRGRGGAIRCQVGKPAGAGEPAALGAYLRELGVPIVGAISGSGRLEGGDVTWLDERTVAVG